MLEVNSFVKGKPLERVVRKATGLNPEGQGSRAAKRAGALRSVTEPELLAATLRGNCNFTFLDGLFCRSPLPKTANGYPMFSAPESSESNGLYIDFSR